MFPVNAASIFPIFPMMRTPSAPNTQDSLIHALIDVLQQGQTLLEGLTDSQFTTTLAEAGKASIGAHYRHSLDHFKTLLDGADTGVLDYDARARDVRLETDRHFAIETTRSYCDAFASLDRVALDTSVSVRCSVCSDDAGEEQVSSTYAREGVYVVAHAVHHYALISVMCRMQGITPPQNFGIAASTIKHRQSQPSACALSPTAAALKA